MKLSIAVLILLSSTVNAESEWDFLPEPLPQSELGLSIGFDSAGGSNQLLFSTLALPKNTQLDLSLGNNATESDHASLSTRQWSVGINSDPLAKFVMGLSYDQWGDGNRLTINSWRARFSFNAIDFSLGVTPQLREIGLKVDPRSSLQRRQFDVDSEGLAIDLGYYGASNWAFTAGYEIYDYSEDLTRLSNERILLVFSPETLQLASGLDENRFSLSASYLLNRSQLGLEWQSSKSGVDNSDATVLSVFTRRALTSAWHLDLQTGLQEVDYADSSIFFSHLGVSYSW